MTEDETVGWHHWLNGHEFEQAPGVGDGQGSLACCSPWGCKELDMTEWLNWTELNFHVGFSPFFLVWRIYFLREVLLSTLSRAHYLSPIPLYHIYLFISFPVISTNHDYFVHSLFTYFFKNCFSPWVLSYTRRQGAFVILIRCLPSTQHWAGRGADSPHVFISCRG